MRAIVVIVALLASTAFVRCCPCRHLEASTDTRDCLRVETVIRHERVLDTVYIEIPKEIVRTIVRDTTSHLETSFAASDARINPDGTLYHSLENKARDYSVKIEKEIVYRDSVVYRDREVKVDNVVEVPRELTLWQRVQMKGFRVIIAVLVIAIFGKGILKRIRTMFG